MGAVKGNGYLLPLGGFLRTYLWVFLFLSRCLFAFECKVHTLSEIEAAIPGVDRHIQEIISATRITGISIAIAKDGRLLFSKAYGDGLTHPLFQAASLSKPVTAFAALKLAESGALSVDTPLSQYVRTPYLPPQPYTELVTLRRILNHTSGMSEDVTGEDRKIYFEPGTAYAYSGAGFLYLQQAIEDSANQAFNPFMISQMKLLGMPKSTFDLFYEEVHYIGAPYSLVSTPEELVAFFSELTHPSPENVSVVKQMTTPSWVFDPHTSRGLGVGLTRCGGELAIHHSGRNFDFHRSQAVAIQPARSVVVVMVRGEDSEGVPDRIARMVVGDYGRTVAPN